MVDCRWSLLVAHSLADPLRIKKAQRVKAGPSASGRHGVAHYGAASQITPGNLRLANGRIHSPGIVPHIIGLQRRQALVSALHNKEAGVIVFCKSNNYPVHLACLACPSDCAMFSSDQ
jgi:hypothetical protein